MRKLALHATLLILFCFFLGSASCLAQRVVREFTTPAFKGYPFRPVVTGDWVIACQNEDPKNNSTVKSIIAYNLANGEIRTMFEGKSFWPEAGGGLVVWSAEPEVIQSYFGQQGDSDESRGQSNLVILDLANWKYYTPGLCTRSANQYDAWGANVAWTGRGGDGSVCVMNLSTNNQAVLTSGSEQRYQPHMGQEWVIWQEGKDLPQLRAYNVLTQELIKITDGNGVKNVSPRCDGKTVVWWQSPGNVVWGYDLKTRKTFKVADGYFADIDIGIVVFMRTVKGKGVVFGKDLATGEEFRISSGYSNQGPSISGKWVVWTASTVDNKIHCAELNLSGRTQ